MLPQMKGQISLNVCVCLEDAYWKVSCKIKLISGAVMWERGQTDSYWLLFSCSLQCIYNWKSVWVGGFFVWEGKEHTCICVSMCLQQSSRERVHMCWKDRNEHCDKETHDKHWERERCLTHKSLLRPNWSRLQALSILMMVTVQV